MSLLKVSDQAMVKLHEARDIRHLTTALFEFLAEALPQEVLFLVLRPLEFELPSFCSRHEFQPICDNYIAGNYVDDIWLKRSPVRPDVPVVRHSLYTPKKMFHQSRFYKSVMVNIGCEYGASLVAWRQNTWLSNLTIFRTEEQGDFTEMEGPILEACHLHFQSAIQRLTSLQEEGLGSSSLQTFIWSLPTAAFVLDWDLKLLHFNASAQQLGLQWRHGDNAQKMKKQRQMPLPGTILEAIAAQKDRLAEMKPNRPGAPNRIPFLEVKHPTQSGLSANISFLPSKRLAVSKGTFLVVLHSHEEESTERESYDRFAGLSRREREVSMLAATGLNSTAIASRSGTSSITVRMQLHSAYKKLGINSRFELVRMLTGHASLDTPTSSVADLKPAAR